LNDVADTIADRRVHPATVPLRFVKDAPSTLLGLPALFAIMSKRDLGQILALAAAIGAVALFASWLRWRRFRYGVGAHELVIESGILNRTRRSIPFHRIQDVDIARGPLQRLFGLATVRIETGGGAKDEGLIDSVTVPQADALRAAVRAGKDGVVESEGTALAVRTLYAMSLPRVLIAGLFNFSLVYIAGLFGVLQQFGGFLPFDIYDPGRWIGLVDTRLTGQIRNGHFGFGAIAAVLLVALLVGVLFGIARTVAANYGFSLTVEGVRYRRTRGLFTRSEVVLSKSRVQLALLRTGPCRRFAGWGALSYQTLSGTAAAGELQTVAPLASDAEIALILAEQANVNRVATADTTVVSSRHLLRTFATTALLPLVGILAVGLFWRPAFIALALVPVLVGIALLERRFHRYALTPDLLFIRRGVWRQRMWMVPTDKVQSVALVQGFVQRRLGLASILVDTAGGSALGGPRVIDIRLGRARALLDALNLMTDYSGRKSGTDR